MNPKGKRLEVFRGGRLGRRRWYHRTVAANGRITADGAQGYTRRRDAIIAAIKSANGLPIYAADRRGVWALERSGTTEDPPDGG